MILCDEFYHAAFPFGMEPFRGALDLFIGTDAVNAAHKYITENKPVKPPLDELWRKGKAGILFKAAHIDGDNGYVAVARLVKRPADKAYVIAGAAAASGL